MPDSIYTNHPSGAIETVRGKAGSQIRGRGGGVDRAPQNWGRGGSGKRAQLTGPLISYYELWRQRR